MFVHAFVESGNDNSDASMQMVLRDLPEQPVDQKCLETTGLIQYVFMIQAFSSQVIGLFETYDASQVKNFFENIDIYLWNTDRLYQGDRDE